MAYGVIRTDLMSGVIQGADLVHVRVYDSLEAGGEMIAAENGLIVKLGDYEPLGEGTHREIHKAVPASASDKLSECAILAGVELMCDERKHDLDEFINPKGAAVRGYLPRSRNLFSVTKECFVGGTVPTVGQTVGIGDAGKIQAGGTNLGVCREIEQAGKYTYYLIRIGAAEEAVGSGAAGAEGATGSEGATGAEGNT